MKQLAILGAGGHSKVLADAAECAGWDRVVLYDDRWPNITQHAAWPVVGTLDNAMQGDLCADGVLVGIGHNAVRLSWCQRLLDRGAPLVTVMHPSATVSRYATLGLGSVVFAGAVINPDVHVGLAGIINTRASLDHDCRLGDGVHISPGASLAGGISIGDRSWIGIGASIKQNVVIGCDVHVGAGAAVVHDVIDGCTVIGVPARERR